MKRETDFETVEGLIVYLRQASPRLVPLEELCFEFRRSPGQMRGLIKMARERLDATTGEFIANRAKRKGRAVYGYTITFEFRPAAFEIRKGLDRAAGHAAIAIRRQHRLPRAAAKTPQDLELYLANLYETDALEFFFRARRRAKEVTDRKPDNARLASEARADTRMPWDTLGLEDPDGGVDE